MLLYAIYYGLIFGCALKHLVTRHYRDMRGTDHGLFSVRLQCYLLALGRLDSESVEAVGLIDFDRAVAFTPEDDFHCLAVPINAVVVSPKAISQHVLAERTGNYEHEVLLKV